MLTNTKEATFEACIERFLTQAVPVMPVCTGGVALEDTPPTKPTKALVASGTRFPPTTPRSR